MKPLIAICLFSCLVASRGFAEDQPTDFRNTRWGMTVDEVKKTEQGEPERETAKGQKKKLAYTDRVAGFKCDVIYLFAYDKLVRAKYIVDVKHTNPNAYLSDYDDLVTALKEKYGKPTSEDDIWDDKLYKNDPDKWGMAVSAGHLKKYTNFDNPKTGILVYLKGDNFEIDLGIEYLSKALEQLEEKADKEQDKGKL